MGGLRQSRINQLFPDARKIDYKEVFDMVEDGEKWGSIISKFGYSSDTPFFNDKLLSSLEEDGIDIPIYHNVRRLSYDVEVFVKLPRMILYAFGRESTASAAEKLHMSVSKLNEMCRIVLEVNNFEDLGRCCLGLDIETLVHSYHFGPPELLKDDSSLSNLYKHFIVSLAPNRDIKWFALRIRDAFLHMDGKYGYYFSQMTQRNEESYGILSKAMKGIIANLLVEAFEGGLSAREVVAQYAFFNDEDEVKLWVEYLFKGLKYLEFVSMVSTGLLNIDHFIMFGSRMY